MVDIIDNKWTQRDAANISASPDGVQGGYAPTTVAPIIQAIRGAIKREMVSTSPIFTSTGSANTYALSFEQPLIIAKGKRISFFANVTNTGASTINLNTTGAVSIVRPDGTALQAGDIRVGYPVDLVYDGTRYILQSAVNLSNYTGTITATSFVGNGAGLTALNATNLTTGTVNNARLPASMTGKTFTSATTVSAGGLNLIDSSLTIQNGQILVRSGAPIFHMQESDTSDKNWFMVVDGGNWSIRENTTGNTRLSITAGTATTSLKMDGNTVWTAGNGGAGSGLDADLLDGQHGAYYLARANGTGTQAISTVAGLQAAIDALNASIAVSTPTGSVTMWTAATSPSGYLICNGAAVSRTTYAALFAVIGTIYGAGNGSTTFNLPDLRGLFVRGLDSGRGLDAGRIIGSYQDSDNKSHNHGVNDPGHVHGGVQNGQSSTGRSTAVDQPPAVFSFGNTWGATTGIWLSASGGAESRPRNLALNYIIKT
ncbi:tail fiber protein [Agrobacterium tumefaciens]|uniref:Tail fiber protein n=1 Tax=Agrobacterium tumefaciens TaxID=358 RepID=A0AA44F8I2_AGRTU|nr:tail fiber protein [Agrobacterium tumefaciens]NTB86863.1 tail fiber protein [Agrobacterium tumefaciens]NTC21192.1 tail fiber protein [Agrobacterium tumefaciens]NTC30740.1 tail fiber protein [Agrobacterium tumefaciens]